MSYDVCLSVSDLLHLLWSSPGPSVLLQMCNQLLMWEKKNLRAGDSDQQLICYSGHLTLEFREGLCYSIMYSHISPTHSGFLQE